MVTACASGVVRKERTFRSYVPQRTYNRRSSSRRRKRMHSRLQERRRVRVGIVGVGNCASSFVQGLAYYRDAKSNEPVPGLMNADLGGYHISDIQVSSAFDVHAGKVGRDV